MYQRDYILRIIETMVEMLAVFFGKLKHKKTEEAAQFLENMYMDLLKKEAAFFHKIPIEKLTLELLEQHHYTHGHLEVLANLFEAEAVLWKARGKNDLAKIHFEKSLVLFEFIDKAYKTYSDERIKKMNGIKQKLKNL